MSRTDPSSRRRPTAQGDRWSRLGCLAIVSAALAGCAVSADYRRPLLEVPASYKEVGPWKLAEPLPAGSDEAWWTVFGDRELDDLVERAGRANQSIAQAEAQYRQARALADAARAGLWPVAGMSARNAPAVTGTMVEIFDHMDPTRSHECKPSERLRQRYTMRRALRTFAKCIALAATLILVVAHFA